jgi:NOL1/NOP2/sun family putative RNA methylase
LSQLPPSFIQSLQNAPSFNAAAFIESHTTKNQLTSIRINQAKTNNQLPIINNQLQIPWCANGYYLTQRPSFTIDPSFHAGAYYVQEASSMFLEQAIKQTVNLNASLKILDLCAAPGGKSTLIQSLLNEQSFLVSNEVIKTRVNILAENITKWGAVNVVVTNNDPIHFQKLSNYFDAIVVDAPCSGSGLFRKDPDAIDEWSENNVTLCSQRQQRILADVLPALKQNGILIYSTCSYSMQEDEDIADWLISEGNMQSMRLHIDDSWGIVETQSTTHKAYGYRFYPDKVKGEGFFIAAFKKLSGPENTVKQQKPKLEKLSMGEQEILNKYLQHPYQFYFVKHGNTILALPNNLQLELPILQQALFIKKAGIKMGTIIKNELVPEHELALSTVISERVEAVEVDENIALQYLRRQNIIIDTKIKGWALVKYKDLPLGWAKILPKRVNNYYPNNWRIVNK